MTAIFDEGVPHDLLPLLRKAGCDVARFPKQWKGTKNGRLLQLIEDAGFACLITSDKNMAYQQNLTARPFAVVVLPSNKLEELKGAAERIADAIGGAVPGIVTDL